MLAFKSKQNHQFFLLALPIFLELILVNIVGNIDTIMLGRYSDEAVGAVGGLTQVLNIQNVLFGFISLGAGILTAQSVGAKQYKKMALCQMVLVKKTQNNKITMEGEIV